MTEQMKQEVEAPDIETASRAYARRFNGSWGKYLLQRQELLIEDCLPVNKQVSVLSVGGGHAQLAALFTRRKDRATVYGSEGAPVELLEPYEIDYRSGNILTLPFEDNSFDVVVSIRMLTHLDSWPKMIAEMCRVSRGQVIIEYPSMRSLNIISPIMFKLKKKIETDTRTFTLFTDTHIKQELSRHGYQVESRKGQFFFPLVVHRILKSNVILRGAESLLRALQLTRFFGSPVVMSAQKK